ncbi:MAG: hypothetical protein V4685_18845 [Bacteroidota bacterium]
MINKTVTIVFSIFAPDTPQKKKYEESNYCRICPLCRHHYAKFLRSKQKNRLPDD